MAYFKFNNAVIIGIILGCFSAALGGSTFVFMRIILEQLDPIALNFLRFGAVGLILFLFLLISSKKISFQSIDLLKIYLIGISMFAAFPILCAFGLQLTTAARGGLIYATMPIITMTMATIFKIEKISFVKIGAVFLAAFGVLLALSDQQSILPSNESFHGDILLLGSVICSSIFVVFSGKFMKKYGNLPVQVNAIISGVFASFLLSSIFSRPLDYISLNHLGWFSLLFLIVPGGVLMMYCWGRALMLISPTQAAISLGCNPIMAMLLGSWLLDETITIRFFVGFILLFSAIIVCSRKL